MKNTINNSSVFKFNLKLLFLSLLYLLLINKSTNAQNFIKVEDSNNPLTQIQLDDYWTGSAWVDYNGDNNLDLFVINRMPGSQPRKNLLFKNNGNGSFETVTANVITSDWGFWFGCSWADYDNDGDIDCHVSGLPSKLYTNNGDGNFTKVTQGPLAASNAAGIGSGWADYNNDGNIDLILVWPQWLSGPPSVGQPTAPQLFTNNGPQDYSFTKTTNVKLISTSDNYMQPSWYDYDDDGDQDLFISRGSGTGLTDFLFRNLLTESGTATFEKITTSPIATDLVEGQHWNWIDIDNDGDLDAFLTNWAEAGPPLVPQKNNLYRNDNATFVRILNDPITTDAEPTVGHIWGDFDNDADLDCIIATDSTYGISYYKNNGDGTFIKDTDGELAQLVHHQSNLTSGDYDNDGDLDLFVSSAPPNKSVLFENKTQNNNWIKINLEGTKSNRTGIGTKVRIKANINGKSVWQRRDLSASNTFFGHNSLTIHFGLADAETIDSLKIEWPSGVVDVYENVEVNHFYNVTEEGSYNEITSVKKNNEIIPNKFELEQNYPNPFNPSTQITYSINETLFASLKIYDVLGKEVETLVEKIHLPGQYNVEFNAQKLSSGVYFYTLSSQNKVETKKLLLLR